MSQFIFNWKIIEVLWSEENRASVNVAESQIPSPVRIALPLYHR